MDGGPHQHWVNFNPSSFQILSDSGDFIICEVGCVVIVQLQQALQLIFCFITNMLEGLKKNVRLIMVKNWPQQYEKLFKVFYAFMRKSDSETCT